MPKYVILGARGQLGQEFVRVLGAQALGLDRTQGNLAHPALLEAVLLEAAPEVIINAAAYNYVDLAESRRSEALAGNFAGPAALARLARRHGWRLLHFSTDYVFGADGLHRPRTESDAPAPVNFYGYSKLVGETAVLRADPQTLVARVAHLFGGGSLSPGRGNLVTHFLALARAGQPIRATRGQRLNPTSVADIARASLGLLQTGQRGLFHLTGGGDCSVAEFARAAVAAAGLREAVIQPVNADPRSARRALHTVLENRRLDALGLPPMPHWRVSLQAFFAAAPSVGRSKI